MTLYALIDESTGRVVNVTPQWVDVPSGWAFIECPEWTAVDDMYTDGGFIHKHPIPVPPTLDVIKGGVLETLATAFARAAQAAHLTSSVGFEIDANDVANRNIEGLVLVMSDTDTVLFCDYNNQFHEVTKAQLETMRKEIIENSQRLYQMKWQFRSLIEAATTVEELDAIKLEFE